METNLPEFFFTRTGQGREGSRYQLSEPSTDSDLRSPEKTNKQRRTQRRQKQRWRGTVCGLLSGGKHTGLWS
jgi:hypothetical protein